MNILALLTASALALSTPAVTEEQAILSGEAQSFVAVAQSAEAAPAAPATPAAPVAAEPTMTYLGHYKLTAYCPCEKCCGKDPSHPAYGITASGEPAQEGVTVAMKDLPFGTRIYIEGLGERIVQDRGVASGRVDIYDDSHADCFQAIYNRTADVYIIED